MQCFHPGAMGWGPLTDVSLRCRGRVWGSWLADVPLTELKPDIDICNWRTLLSSLGRLDGSLTASCKDASIV